MRLKIRTPHVIHQTIDDEVIIINLESGNYYSLLNVAADIWSTIVAGHDIDSISRWLRVSYDGDPSKIESELRSFADALRGEGLVVSNDVAAPADVPEIDGARKGEFVPPTIERFDDMQDLILLDPVHEIDEAEGWPHQK